MSPKKEQKNADLKKDLQAAETSGFEILDCAAISGVDYSTM
jgi:hypothetical protein